MSEVIVSLDRETESDLVATDITNTSNDNQTKNLDVEIGVEIKIKLEKYAIALSELQANAPASHELILQLLLARDSLQEVLNDQRERSVELLIKLSGLDEQLRRQDQAIATGLHLPMWRKVLHPPETNWWWFFEPIQPIPKKQAWDQLDWLFNLLTVLCLTGTVSFASKIIPLVFAGGLSIFESVGLMGPGGMIALVLSSMQGGQGQKKLQDGMAKLGIPPKFQSEVTFVISFLLFTGGYFAQQNLPTYYFNSFRTAGEKAYGNGQMREAKERYEEALKIDNQDPDQVAKVYTALGLLEESIGDRTAALKRYYQSLDMGDDTVLNNLGRVKIYKGEFDVAETFLHLGLQRVDQTNVNAQYQLYRNLGWVSLEKKNYAKAEEYLNKAIEFDKQIPKGNFGKGMANCFKARLYEVQEKPDKAANQWNNCMEFGKPETFNEFQAILKLNPEAGAKLDSKGVFN
jgi:tetratricopeptide (TPR) repeat protein